MSSTPLQFRLGNWEKVTAGELMGRAVRVPDSIGIDALLGELRTNGSLIAIVDR